MLTAAVCGATALGLTAPATAATGPSTPTPPPASTGTSQTVLDSASAQAVKSGKGVVVDALTTENAQTTANPDGTFTWTSSIAPVRVRKAGTWTPIDSGLVQQPDGTFAPKATSAPISISGGGTGPLATMSDGTTPLSITWPTLLPTPTISGNVARYANVLPDVDLQVTVSELGGFSDLLIVKNAAAAANPALKSLHIGMTSAGSTIAVDSAGNTTVKDSAGTAKFTAPTPYMWDSGSGAASSSPIKAATLSAPLCSRRRGRPRQPGRPRPPFPRPSRHRTPRPARSPSTPAPAAWTWCRTRRYSPDRTCTTRS